MASLSHVVDAEGYERRIQKLRNIIFEMERKHAEDMADKAAQIVLLKQEIKTLKDQLLKAD